MSSEQTSRKTSLYVHFSRWARCVGSPYRTVSNPWGGFLCCFFYFSGNPTKILSRLGTKVPVPFTVGHKGWAATWGAGGGDSSTATLWVGLPQHWPLCSCSVAASPVLKDGCRLLSLTPWSFWLFATLRKDVWLLLVGSLPQPAGLWGTHQYEPWQVSEVLLCGFSTWQGMSLTAGSHSRIPHIYPAGARAALSFCRIFLDSTRIFIGPSWRLLWKPVSFVLCSWPPMTNGPCCYCPLGP